MEKKTVLFAAHQAMGARIVPFGGWLMPLHYGSQIEEHHAVRRAAGMFDVSHMQVLDLLGEQARGFLRRLLANDVARLTEPGKALYSCMLNERGGVIDDLIVYFIGEGRYRMVVNAATAEKDLAWILAQAAGFEVVIEPRDELAMIAVQGPAARERVLPLLPGALRAGVAALAPFHAATDGEWFVARTGYTGEDGFEVLLPGVDATAFWEALAAAGVAPCGLGARDTLRLEAGMNLYGSDMDEQTLPLEAGLGWTIAWEPVERDFIGRPVLDARRGADGNRRFVGLVLRDRGILRDHQRLFSGDREIGGITSGGFSPTLERSIALARVDSGCPESCEVEIRGRRLEVQVVRPPFARNGRAVVKID
ncbi:MAG: glycine cleavage system protein T [Candidatus Sedimenticola endophacoides]|uniref:Aminomethyltransferase n=2 Tax=Candidatus Sedimenticola endophacoides TaxID=2548426 RepID=A0A6N4E1J4_9GAMM|nr:MAG: glycine cleavage system protein T [Candidatus Sedimenticola endophacoides]OQX37343.1 MAG: glycine cleavage system protein T [Candidatus Sedimenticola endophacoides]OQX40288.1 MAG: glycine cleavage system protein T [Candidatus Sedimenticola endophacoides]PUE00223.1 MAG: glycine cleavage system protein T [Candidatus Sedimenticola endophacoides]PUE03255.1 MAG: glycine cleavage system protein T [Candidatus Sedimenticola endophacoides]